MLSENDYRAVSAFLQRLYAQRDPDGFPHFLVRELRALVGAEQVSWNRLAPTVPMAEVVIYPTCDDPLPVIDTFAGHMHEHPGIRAWLSRDALGPSAISDFLSARAYHHSRIYQQLFQRLGYEDQLFTALTPPHGGGLALAFGRGRRGFSQHDRGLVEFVTPHLLQSYRNAQALARSERALAGHREVAAALGQCIVELDGDARPLRFPDRARCWLRQYFSDAPISASARLPDTLSAWVRQRRGYNGEAGGLPPLVRRRGGRRLLVRLFTLEGDAALLVLEEHTEIDGAEQLRSSGLTRREIEVLIEIEGGRTNTEVATELSLSPATIKKHLDNIYTKLGVSNRTAAVARLRGSQGQAE